MKKITFEDILEKYREKKIWNEKEDKEVEEEPTEGEDDSDSEDDSEDMDVSSMSTSEKLSLVKEILDSCDDEEAESFAKKVIKAAEKFT